MSSFTFGVADAVKAKNGTFGKWIEKIGIDRDSANVAIRRYSLYLEAEVKALLATKQKTFVSKPTEVKKPLTAQLAEEAMAFMTFQENSGKVDKINSFLQQFEVISEFEEFGLFFESDIVKLNKIYTMKEIVDAVTETIDLLK